MRKKLRWVWGVPDHLGQTSYAEIRILVTKYISKLDEIQNTNYITCHVFNCLFQILVFQLVDNSANKHAEQRRPTFFSCFTSGSCTLAEYRPPVPPLPPNPGYATVEMAIIRPHHSHAVLGRCGPFVYMSHVAWCVCVRSRVMHTAELRKNG